MPRKRSSFGGRFDLNLVGSFSAAVEKKSKNFEAGTGDNPFRFTPIDPNVSSNIRYYDHDSTWVRWRRGYELYCLMQTLFGSKRAERNKRGDFRVFCTFQQFPNVFIPARLFTFPSSDVETGEHIVGIRDTNSFSFYEYGLPISAVRYLQAARTATYSQIGTALTINLSDHGFKVGDNVYIKVTSGASTTETLAITSVSNQNTFGCVATPSITATGNANVQKVTTFSDPKWTEQRVTIRFIPTPVSLFAGERLADRLIERDPGIAATYTRSASITVTVTCASPHGLVTGNEVYLEVSSGAGQSGLFRITVLSTTQFTVDNFASGITSGALILKRRIRGYDYGNYVGYTVTGTDDSTNEILFQREDSYGAVTINSRANTVVPAQRGFEVGRYLTTEIRYQCTCQDFLRRESLNFYSEATKKRIPRTPITSLGGGTRINRSGNTVETKDDVGVFSDLLYVNINNFYELPGYEDTAEFSYSNLMYYQIRWCKHIYAAMWSVVHDEGTNPVNITARYTQSGGPNATINAPNHGLETETRIELEVTSGNLSSGDYVVIQVVDADNFVIVAPISLTTAGYCLVKNLRVHEYVRSWLYEPNDQPVGDALNKFYERFDKEFGNTSKQLEKMRMLGYGTPWIGVESTLGDRNQPLQIANYKPQLLTMLATDTIRRDKQGALDRDGPTKNTTATTLFMLQKVLNIPIQFLDDVKFGILDQPLTSYTNAFRFSEIDCDIYRNGTPVRLQIEALDCGTYTNGGRTTAPFANIDSGIYVNT